MPSNSIRDLSWDQIGDILKDEGIILARLAWPTALANVFSIGINSVHTMFLGHLSQSALAAGSLGASWFNLFAFLMFGPGSALASLASQSFGAKNIELTETWFVRSTLWTFLICLPQVFFIMLGGEFTSQILGRPEPIPNLVERYCIISIPGFLFTAQTFAFTSYLQAINHVMLPVWVNGFNLAANYYAHWLFIDYLQLGFDGAPMAMSLTRFFALVVMIAYIAYIWQGPAPSLRRMIAIMTHKEEMRIYLRIATAGMIMFAVSFWLPEVTIFTSSILGDDVVGAYMILLLIASVLGMLTLSASTAVSVRVGNLMGAGMVQEAKVMSVASMIGGCIVTGIAIAIEMSFRDEIVAFFTDDEDVRQRVYEANGYAMGFTAFNTIQLMASGIFRGMGRQDIIAVTNTLGVSGTGCAVGLILVFVAGMDIRGFWLGNFVGTMFSTLLVAIAFAFVIDWDYEAQEAVERSKKRVEDEESQRSGPGESVQGRNYTGDDVPESPRSAGGDNEREPLLAGRSRK
eukprot:Clim_evm17s145 gene=Clim_evmTU17s145